MRHTLDYIKKHPLLLLVIIPAFFLYMLIILPSGSYYCFPKVCGINFWGVHGHDAIWHLAIANASFNTVPFKAPTFAGENLYGYNYLLDFIIFLFSKVGIDSLFSYFKLLPIVWFIFFTLLLIVLARKIKDSSLFTGLFLFFNYFAGSFSFLLTVYHQGTIKGSSTLLPLPAMHMMSNLPYAFSLLFFIPLLIFIHQKKISYLTVVLASLFIFINFGLKFYGGVVSLFLFGVYLLFLLPKQKIRKSIIYFSILAVFVVSAVFTFYNPFTSLKTGSVFGFAPFALVHPITENSDQFYLRNMTDARYYLLSQGVGPRLIAIEALNLIIFLFFYLGTRFFGFINILWSIFKRKFENFDAVVSLTILFATLLTILLVQKAEWWNTIQFFFYTIFLMTIFLTKLTYDLLKNKTILSVGASIIIMLFSIPPSIDLINLFWVTPGAAYLSKGELEALRFLKKQQNGVVYAPFYNKNLKDVNFTNPLYRYEDTSYVSAFSGKPTYLADILQLRLTGVNYQKRLEKVQNLDCGIVNEIDYIYEIRHIPNEGKIVDCNESKFKKIYESKEVFIYKVIK